MNRILEIMGRSSTYWPVLAFVLWMAVIIFMPNWVISLIAGWAVGGWIYQLHRYFRDKELS